MKKILLFLLLAALSTACKKDSDDNDDTLTSSAEFYFVGKMDGTAVRQEVTATNDVQLTSSNGGSVGSTNCTFDYGCAIGPSSGLEPYFEVDFPALFSGDCSTEGTLFHGLFRTGDWGFGSTTGKVEVLYFDGTEVWSSSNGTQSGATFKVTRSDKLETIFGPSQTVGGTVSCQLYNAKGQSKKLENGSFLLNYEPWF